MYLGDIQKAINLVSDMSYVDIFWSVKIKFSNFLKFMEISMFKQKILYLQNS